MMGTSEDRVLRPKSQPREEQTKKSKSEHRGKTFDESEKELSTSGEQVGDTRGVGIIEIVKQSKTKKQRSREYESRPSPPAGFQSPITCKLKSSKLVTLVPLVAEYNTLDEDATYQDRFRALRLIDDEAHGILEQHSVPDLSTREFTTQIQTLLQQTEAIHEQLVDELRQRTRDGEDGHLPFDVTDLPEEQREGTAQMWQSIVRNEGGLKVGGDDNPMFQRSTFASIAKLMQGEFGRGLVGTANQPGNEIRITPEGNKQEAQPDETKLGDMKSTGKKSKGKDDPESFMRDLFNGRETGYNGRHTRFERNQGTGSTVHMPMGHKEPRAVGASGNEVMTPSFIALGHELGHAVKSKLGAKGAEIPFVEHGKNLSSFHWGQNPEELMNVRGVENPLRREHNISERGNYQSLEETRLESLMMQLIDVRDAVGGNEDSDKILDATQALIYDFKGYDDLKAFKAFETLVEKRLEKARKKGQPKKNKKKWTFKKKDKGGKQTGDDEGSGEV